MLRSSATDENGVRLSRTPPRSGQVPDDCERIIIVGAGGFGREVLQWARQAWPEQAHKISGFLSEDAERLTGTNCELPVLAEPSSFQCRHGDYLLFAIGIPRRRRIVAENLLASGGRFLTLIHPTAIVTESARVLDGAVICPNSVISDSAVIGRFVLINYFASVAHDSIIEDFAVLSPYAAVAGYARVCEDAFLGLQASVAPGVTLGLGSRVSGHSWARVDVPEHSLVYGNPPTVRPLLTLEP